MRPEPDLRGGPIVSQVPSSPRGLLSRDRGQRWGCSRIAHEKLGWCAHCPGATAACEMAAWRLLALGAPVPSLERVRQWVEGT